MRVVAAWLALVGLVAPSVSIHLSQQAIGLENGVQREIMSITRVSTEQEQASPKDAAELGGNQPRSAGWDRERIEGQVVVNSTQAKGRCLFANKDFRKGDLIFVEGPILAATPSMSLGLWDRLQHLNEQQAFEWDVGFYFAALMSLENLGQDKIRLIEDKFLNNAGKSVKDDVNRILGSISFLVSSEIDEGQLLRIVDAWHSNAFEHPTEEEGFVLYDRISMTSHSCKPNAYVSIDIDGSLDLHLKAEKGLIRGDEVTISYFRNDYRKKPYPARQDHLRRHWGFECQCTQCNEEASMQRFQLGQRVVIQGPRRSNGKRGTIVKFSPQWEVMVEGVKQVVDQSELAAPKGSLANEYEHSGRFKPGMPAQIRGLGKGKDVYLGKELPAWVVDVDGGGVPAVVNQKYLVQVDQLRLLPKTQCKTGKHGVDDHSVLTKRPKHQSGQMLGKPNKKLKTENHRVDDHSVQTKRLGKVPQAARLKAYQGTIMPVMERGQFAICCMEVLVKFGQTAFVCAPPMDKLEAGDVVQFDVFMDSEDTLCAQHLEVVGRIR